MIALQCQSCGQKASVQSLLSAARQRCDKCGRLLMGALDGGTRVDRPSGFGESLAGPVTCVPSSKGRVACGILLGGVAGILAVVFLASPGNFLPLQVRGVLLGALMGVLLAPVIAVALFIFMIVPIVNIGLLGVLGDCTWRRISEALCSRRLRPLLLPFLVFFALPMGLCGYAGWKSKTSTAPIHLAAALGASALGAVVGGLFANLPRQRPEQPLTIQSRP